MSTGASEEEYAEVEITIRRNGQPTYTAIFYTVQNAHVRVTPVIEPEQIAASQVGAERIPITATAYQFAVTGKALRQPTDGGRVYRIQMGQDG